MSEVRAPSIATTWDDGLARVAERLAALRERWPTRPRLRTERGRARHTRDVFERFMTHLGSARLLYTISPIRKHSMPRNERLFGEHRLPYYDLRNARYLLSFGADFLGQWLSPVHHSLSFGHAGKGEPTRECASCRSSRACQSAARRPMSGSPRVRALKACSRSGSLTASWSAALSRRRSRCVGAGACALHHRARASSETR